MKFLRVLQWLEKTYFTDKDLKSKFNESQLVETLSPFDHELKMSVVCEAFASMSDSDGEFNDSVSTIQSNIGALELTIENIKNIQKDKELIGDVVEKVANDWHVQKQTGLGDDGYEKEFEQLLLEQQPHDRDSNQV
ncbi:hypothetical protein D0Y65_045515 [Glycine soja]|uniref:Uncharacterized protein n=1 Tax=Glycine soja TaxID=3848 RepID=A0A445G5A8_GLYSO|nr:hypothetical protein D0Y65_045515 [Glycine soja]